MLAVRLPPELETRLNALSARTGKPKSWYARQAIEEYIGDWEDLAIAEQRMADHLSGKTKAIPIEDLMAEYGLED